MPVKGFEYGMGFDGVGRRGSEMIDNFMVDADGNVHIYTEHGASEHGMQFSEHRLTEACRHPGNHSSYDTAYRVAIFLSAAR